MTKSGHSEKLLLKLKVQVGGKGKKTVVAAMPRVKGFVWSRSSSKEAGARQS
jgi:hypothetical protein